MYVLALILLRSRGYIQVVEKLKNIRIYNFIEMKAYRGTNDRDTKNLRVDQSPLGPL